MNKLKNSTYTVPLINKKTKKQIGTITINVSDDFDIFDSWIGFTKIEDTERVYDSKGIVTRKDSLTTDEALLFPKPTLLTQITYKIKTSMKNLKESILIIGIKILKSFISGIIFLLNLLPSKR